MQNIFSSPVGDLIIRIVNDKLAGLEYLSSSYQNLEDSFSVSHTALLTEVKKQLQHYFANPKYHFSLPIELTGTELQRKIWQELQLIESGQVITYGDLAKKLNTGPRIIGNACRRNPIAIIVPCHRVVGVNGLCGYSGQTEGKLFDVKKWLLDYEEAKA